jgi:hypothetical protein
MEESVTALAGPKGKHNPNRTAVRHGHEHSSVTLGGRRVAVQRPRVRAADGSGELPVAAYELFSGTEILDRLALERMLGGLSTRRYPVGLEPVGAQVEQAASATSKSAVSRRFVAMTHTALAELLARDLSDLDLVALLVDGVHFGEHKALRRAVLDVFDHPVIARCQQHKLRNIRDKLPERLGGPVEHRMRTAWDAPSALDAEAQLAALARELDKTHPGAAASLREGLAETLTVLRLGVSPTLARTLRSTDESFKASVRLLAGAGLVRLGAGRGRPRSEEQDLWGWESCRAAWPCWGPPSRAPVAAATPLLVGWRGGGLGCQPAMS